MYFIIIHNVAVSVAFQFSQIFSSVIEQYKSYRRPSGPKRQRKQLPQKAQPQGDSQRCKFHLTDASKTRPHRTAETPLPLPTSPRCTRQSKQLQGAPQIPLRTTQYAFLSLTMHIKTKKRSVCNKVQLPP